MVRGCYALFRKALLLHVIHVECGHLVVVVVLNLAKVVIDNGTTAQEVGIGIHAHIVYEQASELTGLRCRQPAVSVGQSPGLGLLYPVGEVLVERIVVVIGDKLFTG